MSDVFSTRFQAGWATMDANAHMANTAFLDAAVDCRMTYFSDRGFPTGEFRRLGIGPVVRRDLVEYFREILLLESFDVTLRLAGISGDGSRFRLYNEILEIDGAKAASVTTDGGWLDLSTRRLTRPPPALLEALRGLVRTDDCREFESSIRDE